jgi:hypothetical protein
MYLLFYRLGTLSSSSHRSAYGEEAVIATPTSKITVRCTTGNAGQ